MLKASHHYKYISFLDNLARRISDNLWEVGPGKLTYKCLCTNSYLKYQTEVSLPDQRMLFDD